MDALIIKETNRGYTTYSVKDEMLKNREIELVGPVDIKSANSLITQLLYLQKEEPEQEIKMYIDSPGGNVVNGLAIYDVMQAISCPVTTICRGYAASMGAIIFAAGDKRQMLKHSKLMIHDPMANVGGSALEMQENTRRLMETRECLAKILAEKTGKKLDEIYEETKQDRYFDAEEAIEFGLADEILTTI